MTTIEPELGETVADARRLARKAAKVFIHYQCGPDDWQTSCVKFGPNSFLRALRYYDDDGKMPCRLYKPGDIGELWLQIGR
jgi:hypothetical protein